MLFEIDSALNLFHGIERGYSAALEDLFHWAANEQKLKSLVSQMAVQLSVLSAGHPYPPGIFLVLISVRE
jgi:hypothetical protein